jgi:O-antigen/teichoic acid export membrane protein
VTVVEDVELPHDTTHQRARRGIKLLMGRQVFVQILTLAAGIVLARALDPTEFGLYAIASFLVGAFALFGDFGLASSLVQRKEQITELDLRVGFSLQQITTTVVVILLLIAAPWLASLYPKAPPGTDWLVRALAFSLYLTSWRSMSVLQLERVLRYDRLAWIEVIEVLAFQTVAILMALNDFGVWSFVVAALVRGLVGAILAFAAAPWHVRFAFDRAAARRILHFGAPFQIQSVANQLGSWITPLFVGTLIGPGAVGYLTWASSNGRKPLMLVDNVMRVAFPHLARIQEDSAEVERTLTRYLTYLLCAAGLWFSLLATAGPSVVTVLYTDKWSAAVPALIMYAAVVPLEVLGWVIGIALNATGRVAFTSWIVVARTAAQIVLSVPLTLLLGFNGVPLAILVCSAALLPWILRGLGPGAPLRVMRPLVWLVFPVLAASAVGLLLRGLGLPLAMRGAVIMGAVTIVYAAATWAAGPAWLIRWPPQVPRRGLAAP